MNIPDQPLFLHAAAILRRLVEAGHESYWAGGCVRDLLLERTPKDIDIATAARPEEILRLFPEAKAIGRSFGVMMVARNGLAYEIATFRSDDVYEDGRRPRSVRFSTPEEDAQRRDFTINGMFYDPLQDRIVDYVKGQQDLAARWVRSIGDPDERFAEDYLRLLRAIRFAAVLEFQIEEHTFEAIKRHAPRVGEISVERIRQELDRILLEAPKPGDALGLLLDSGLLAVILPEVVAMKGQEQPPEFHPEGDVFTHTQLMLNALRAPSRTLAYAVLLHDVGKPPSASIGPGRDGVPRIRFDRHADIGADMAEAILRRLRFPRRDIEAIVHMIRGHMRFMDVQNMKRSTLRKLLGAPTFAEELELHRLDCISSHGKLDNYDFLVRERETLEQEKPLPPRWVTGKDLLALGISEGPALGALLKRAYNAQLEGRFPSREELLEWVRETARGSGATTANHAIRRKDLPGAPSGPSSP